MTLQMVGWPAIPLGKKNALVVSRGGATVLKVGGTILRAERAKNFFDPPTFWPVGGQNIA